MILTHNLTIPLNVKINFMANLLVNIGFDKVK